MSSGYQSSPSVDAFARLRVSNPTVLFDTTHLYDLNPLLWETVAVGGSCTHAAATSSATLSTGGGTDNNYCIRQTYQYFHYQPGKSQYVIMTAILGALKENVAQRIGYYDDNDGVFFEQNGEALGMVIRSSTSGTPVDTRIEPEDWNGDPLNGNGPSGMEFDPTKGNIFWIDMEWLGVGAVRFGVFGPNGLPVVCHQAQNANALPVVYMRSADRPLRYEIRNIGAASGTTTLSQLCATVVSEGGSADLTGLPFAAPSSAVGIASVAVTTRRAVLSIRPKTTFNSIINRTLAEILDIHLTAANNGSFVEVVFNPTYTGTPVWTSADANSAVEWSPHTDAAAGAFTGGTVVDSSFVVAGQGSSRSLLADTLSSRLPMSLDYAGTAQRGYAIVCTSLSGTSNVTRAAHWKEIR